MKQRTSPHQQIKTAAMKDYKTKIDVYTIQYKNYQNIVGEWSKRDAKLKLLIAMNIGKEQINHIKDSQYAVDAWNTLKRVHAHNGLNRLMSIERGYVNASMKDGETMRKYITRMYEYRDELISLGQHTAEDVHVMRILSGLPKEYAGIRQSLSVRSGDLTIEKSPPSSLTNTLHSTETTAHRYATQETSLPQQRRRLTRRRNNHQHATTAEEWDTS